MNDARPADVDGAQFAPFEEERAAGFLVIGHFERLERHRPADQQAVKVGKNPVQLARAEKVSDEESVPQLLRVHQRNVLRSWHPSDCIGKHGRRLAAGNRAVNAGFKDWVQSAIGPHDFHVVPKLWTQ